VRNGRFLRPIPGMILLPFEDTGYAIKEEPGKLMENG